MNKNYIAPCVEVANIGFQNIICASGEPAPTPANGIPVLGGTKTTDKVW